MIDVMFRREVFNGINRFLIYMPYEFSDNKGSGTCLTLEESHSSCAHDYILRSTKPLKRDESNIACHYILKSFGYDPKEINIIKRINYKTFAKHFKRHLGA